MRPAAPPTPAASAAPGQWLWSLVAGAVFASASLVAAYVAQMPVQWNPPYESNAVSAATVFAGVLLTGSSLWWLLVARHRRADGLRGAATGVLVAFLSYPIVLLLAEFFQADWHLPAAGSSLAERLVHVVMLAGFELLTTGFAATIALALAGMVVGVAEARLSAGAPLAAGRRRSLHEIAVLSLGIGAASIIALLAVAFVSLSLLPMRPLSAPSLSSAPNTYEEALNAFALIKEHEANLPLHPRCGSMLLTHGEKVAQIVVFLHGLTNCPAQADELAPWLFAMGYNVLVPRLPGHGEADALTFALAHVTAEDFVSTARSSLDLAQALGDKVIVVGLSAGGTATAHQAQHQDKVSNAILVAPFLATGIVPQWAAQAATNLLLLAPNMMVWWDPRNPYSSADMDYAYPRFATHALAQLMRLGHIVASEANTGAPTAQRIGFLLNEADLAVDNRLAQSVAAAWSRHGGNVAVSVLPQTMGLPHDLIDPRQPDAAVDLIYPMLVEMMSPEPAGR